MTAEASGLNFSNVIEFKRPTTRRGRPFLNPAVLDIIPEVKDGVLSSSADVERIKDLPPLKDIDEEVVYSDNQPG